MMGRDIKGSTVGIVGLGNIGTTIAKKFQAMKASKILYSGHKQKEEGNDALDTSRKPDILIGVIF